MIITFNPDYHSRIQIYESPNKRRKKEDTATLRNVDAQIEFDTQRSNKLKIFIEALPNCLPLTIRFNMVDQKRDKISCPCSKTMLGWATVEKCDKNNVEDYCRNKGYSPQSILSHVRRKSIKYMYHHAIKHCLSILYCNSDGRLRKCVPNDVVLPALDQKYKDLMNWEI